VSLWLTVPLALLSGALLVRIFIIFHDCAHGSYFNSRRVNDCVGVIAGVLTFSPTGAGNTRSITAAQEISIDAEQGTYGR
jgi:fatty acid desaturase